MWAHSRHTATSSLQTWEPAACSLVENNLAQDAGTDSMLSRGSLFPAPHPGQFILAYRPPLDPLSPLVTECTQRLSETGIVQQGIVLVFQDASVFADLGDALAMDLNGQFLQV